MPKEKSTHPRHRQNVRDNACGPYPSSDWGSNPLSGKNLSKDGCAGRNDWEGVVCPVCMETPHNAVLLQCSSHEKGCRPYMCDTSYRHSNCFDQYLKAHSACQKTGEDQLGGMREADVLGGLATGIHSTEQEASRQNSSMGLPENAAGTPFLQTSRLSAAERVSKGDLLGLTCPLCRGGVKGCKVVKAARDVLNRKVRVCAREACAFSGSYQELRTHARRDHPTVRPAEIDPIRQRSWVQMERQRELGDVLSVIQASMPRVTISGDYAIDGENDSINNAERTFPFEEGHLLTVFLSFQVFGSVHSFVGGRSLPPIRGLLRRHRRSGSARQGLWGEILQQSQNTESGSGAAANESESEGFWDREHRQRHR